MSVETFDLWCLVIDHNQEPIGSCFLVSDLPRHACVEHLRKKVKKEKPNVLANVDTDHLKVWKVENPESVHSTKELLEYITRIQFYEDEDAGSADNTPAARSLFPTTPLLDIIPLEDNKLSFLIQIPSDPGTSQSMYWRADLTNTLFFVRCRSRW
jgi:hypothetical protein